MKKRYQDNRDDIAKIGAVKRAIKFANEDEKKRHTNFQACLRDCFSHACVCCHKILTTSGVRPGARHIIDQIARFFSSGSIYPPMTFRYS